jgi:hypothetical protein
MSKARWVLTTRVMVMWISIAYAEGTSVLWIKHEPQGGHGFWDLWASYSSRAACQKARRQVIRDTLLRDQGNR